MDMTGKTIVVTGATSGIGRAAAEALAGAGALVIAVGRSPERCAETERCLRALHAQGQGHCLLADLSLQSQVHALVDEIGRVLAQEGLDHLDGLVNNAAAFTYWLAYTAEGFETQWAVNVLAPFLLTRALLPLLSAAPAARIVNVSSASHYGVRLNWADVQLRRRYNGLRAYGQSKLANILLAIEINRRCGPEARVRAFAADPGLVKTDIGFKGTPPVARWIWSRRRAAGIGAEESARGIVFLLSEPGIHADPAVYWKHGRAKRPSRQAGDAADAARLWALCEQMCASERMAQA